MVIIRRPSSSCLHAARVRRALLNSFACAGACVNATSHHEHGQSCGRQGRVVEMLRSVVPLRKSAKGLITLYWPTTSSINPRCSMSHVARVDHTANAALGPRQLCGSHWSSNSNSVDGRDSPKRLSASHAACSYCRVEGSRLESASLR